MSDLGRCCVCGKRIHVAPLHGRPGVCIECSATPAATPAHESFSPVAENIGHQVTMDQMNRKLDEILVYIRPRIKADEMAQKAIDEHEKRLRESLELSTDLPKDKSDASSQPH